MMRESLSVLPVALDLAWNDPEENLNRIDAAIQKGVSGVREPASLLFLFPEVTLTAFVTESPKSFSVDEKDGPVARLRDIAAKYGVGLVAGFPETHSGGAKPFNASLLIGPDGHIHAHYRKMHLFTFGKNPESERYSKGNAGAVALYRGWNIGLSVCFDARFTRLYHAYAQAGVDLILVSSCWVGGEHKSYQYKTLTSAHAIATQAYVAAVNRSGRDPNFDYDGSAYVFSPYGENMFESAPVELSDETLAECRGLVVRPSDCGDYPINFNTARA